MRWRWNGDTDTVQEAARKGRYVEMKFWTTTLWGNEVANLSIFTQERKEGPGTNASKSHPPILVSLLGNSYAKHGRWIARLVTLLRTLSLSVSLYTTASLMGGSSVP